MPVDNIRLSEQAKNQLVTLKRRTKITQWNVLCRWAVCCSLAEPNRPPAMQIPADSNVEMSWKTFAGHYGDELWALLRARVHADGLPLDEDTLAGQFRLHLHRGIGYLAGDPRVTDITGLLSLALEPEGRKEPADPEPTWPGRPQHAPDGLAAGRGRDETPGSPAACDETTRCQVCGGRVARAPTGRPRAYCSRSCQARAYRARKEPPAAGDGR